MSEKLKIDSAVCIAYYMCMKKIQYTIRNIPPVVDQVLRKRAQRTGASFNTTVVEALTIQTLGEKDVEKAKEDVFSQLWGANSLDENFDKAIEEQSAIDEQLWS